MKKSQARRLTTGLALIAWGLTAALMILTAQAGPNHDHDVHGHSREQGSHVHGIAQLDIVAENGELYLALSSPAANIVGFEQAPQDARQRAALDAASEQLRDAGDLFIPSPAAGCRMIEAHIDLPWPTRDAADSEHAHDAASHADITAEYHFSCAAPAALTGLRVQLFELFPATERLVLQYIIGDRQGAAIATPSEPMVRF